MSNVILHNKQDFKKMHKAGFLAWDLLERVSKMIVPGISTQEIDKFVASYTKQKGGRCAPLNYHGFPKSVCTSVNHVVCHGIPDSKCILTEGDIVNVDVTPILNGFHGDSSRTFCVGKVSVEAQKLVSISLEGSVG